MVQTPEGKPDLSGFFMLENTPDMAMGRDHSVPYTDRGRTAFLEHDDKNDPIMKCLSPGMPRIMQSPTPAQFVQTSNYLVILFEYMHVFRSIPLDGRPHRTNLEPSFLGDSVGHWEGDALVVDTIGLRDGNWTWLDTFGHQHSENLHIVERFRRGANGIDYEYTLDDPAMYSKPWRVQRTLTPLAATKAVPAVLLEYECNENNRDAAHLVSTRTDAPFQDEFWYKHADAGVALDHIVAWSREHRSIALGLVALSGGVIGALFSAIAWPRIVRRGPNAPRLNSR